jgi:hypothetical protein
MNLTSQNHILFTTTPNININRTLLKAPGAKSKLTGNQPPEIWLQAPAYNKGKPNIKI